MLALALAVMMLLGSVSAFAAQGDAITKTKGEIVVRNAAKGETYNIYKIFGATISEVKGAATTTAAAKGHADSGKADGISYFLLNNATTLPIITGRVVRYGFGVNLRRSPGKRMEPTVTLMLISEASNLT